MGIKKIVFVLCAKYTDTSHLANILMCLKQMMIKSQCHVKGFETNLHLLTDLFGEIQSNFHSFMTHRNWHHDDYIKTQNRYESGAWIFLATVQKPVQFDILEGSRGIYSCKLLKYVLWMGEFYFYFVPPCPTLSMGKFINFNIKQRSWAQAIFSYLINLKSNFHHCPLLPWK